ncbi:MAG: LLM class flavin-dependent oxidoreductase [Acidimicrobiaceae bacterium]|nr:LLM class flavin-dependent oxidoreductase [Acidimicrobiaceae bacterium]
MSNSFRPGVWFQGGLNVGTTVELAVRAESAGVDSVWLAEGPVARDAFITLSAIATKTSHVELATGVVNPFTRHPAQLAASFATLDELSQGRAVAGVGFGARDFLLPLGVDVSKPLTTAREMVQIIRGLLNRETIELHSEKFELDNVRLGLRPFRQSLPIYLAATGPKMCALAGQVADGIYLLYGTQSYVTSSLALAGEKRPVDAAPFRVASPTLMAVDGDDSRALTGAKIGLGLMLTEPNGEGLLEANGIDPELAQRIRDALSTGGVKALAAAVDETIVDKLIISGSHAECVERLVEAYGWGVNEPQILLAGEDPTVTLKVLADTKQVLA